LVFYELSEQFIRFERQVSAEENHGAAKSETVLGTVKRHISLLTSVEKHFRKLPVGLDQREKQKHALPTGLSFFTPKTVHLKNHFSHHFWNLQPGFSYLLSGMPKLSNSDRRQLFNSRICK
tara:strand:- start:302 stop:664 length:363 start_codon:yes stop_codon:yes gene_type:complete